MGLRELIKAVEDGTFLLDAMPAPHETTAYRAFGGSLDAAKALHAAILSWPVTLHISEHAVGGFVATLFEPIPPDADKWTFARKIEAKASNPARAWLLAILKALGETP